MFWRPFNVTVTTMESEMSFSLHSSTTGRELFDQVARTIGLREVWYFGLQYVDSKNLNAWLNLEKKVASQDVKKENPLKFKLLVKFYPEDISEEIIQNITLRLFYLQTKQDIVADVLYCPPETCVFLASYAAQVKFGDYVDVQNHADILLDVENMLPQRVLEQHMLTPKQWEDRIIACWMGRQGLTNDEAMLEYLKLAQDLEMFGVNYFEIKNQKNTSLWLGITSGGLNVYANGDRLSPKIAFTWSELKSIVLKDKRFVIKPTDKSRRDSSDIDLVFISPHARINKRIMSLCMGNHELYLRRRAPDNLEIRQLKHQADIEREAKQREREQLRKQIVAREQAEKQQKKMATILKEMQDKLDLEQKQLTQAHNEIERLSSQLELMHKDKLDLEKRQAELEELNKKLAQLTELEHAEREKLQQEIDAKQKECTQIQEKVHQSEEESRRLHQELEQARQRLENVTIGATTTTTTTVTTGDTTNSEVFNHLQPNEHEENDEQLGGDVEIKLNTAIDLNGDGDGDGDGSGGGGGGDGHSGDEGDRHNNNNNNNNRSTQISKVRSLKEHMISLSRDLSLNRDNSKLTMNDVLHKENVKHGRDKYKTLKEIRKGNTLRRVDYFENM